MAVRRVVVDHVLFVVADLEASRRPYTTALAPLGYEELHVQMWHAPQPVVGTPLMPGVP